VRLATDVVRTTGRIVLVGWSHGPVQVDTVSLMRKEAELVGSRNSTGAFGPVLRLLEDGVVDAGAMITHHVAFEQAPEALALLDRGEPAVKVVVAGPEVGGAQTGAQLTCDGSRVDPPPAPGSGRAAARGPRPQ
jgi:threonine dehydrogenase-like Zn-dependent dehydrogenase